MIFDSIKNLELYANLVPHIKDISIFISEIDVLNIEPGRHNIGERGCFALVFDYKTRPFEDCKGEAHKKYIDIHYVCTNSEVIGVSSLDNCNLGPYGCDSDYMLAEGKFNPILVCAGNFVLLYPHEAHVTGGFSDFGQAESIRKVVFKVPVSNNLS